MYIATAKQLPSGSWKIKVYDKETRKYVSFTSQLKSRAVKNEVELMAAAEWKNDKKRQEVITKNMFKCVQKYIGL